MSELNERIAARRNELAQQREKDEAFRKRQEEQVLDTIAASLSDNSVRVRKEGDDLTLDPVDLPTIDVAGLKRAKIEKLLKREARRRWTPADNWLVIGCIVGGLCLLHLGGFGLLPLGIGLWRQWQLNKRYRSAVEADYPRIFNAAA